MTVSQKEKSRLEPATRGFLFALSAYLLWGIQPIYMKALAHIPASEVVAHRIIWSVPIAGVVLYLLGRTADIRAALRSPRTLAMAALTASIITVNWGIYVWAIAVDRAIEAALGYYINPLFSIFLAAVVLGERLNPMQMAAIGLAVLAVALLTWESGGLPWVSIGLCVTWGFYGLFKKTLPIGPNQGFFLEVLLLTPPALVYVVWLYIEGQGHFGTTTAVDFWLLFGCGAVTAAPLMLFANGAADALHHRHHAVYRADLHLPDRRLHLQRAVQRGTRCGVRAHLGGADHLHLVDVQVAASDLR
jgi:chloramphenicol-sensitive protein RarD